MKTILFLLPFRIRHLRPGGPRALYFGTFRRPGRAGRRSARALRAQRAVTAIAARRTAVRQAQASARAAVAARGGTVIESLDTVFNGLIVSIPDTRAAELLQIPGAVNYTPCAAYSPS